MIQFKPVTKETFNDAIDMQVHDEQKGFMEDNLFSIAECVFEKDFLAKVIYDDDLPVGFILYYFVKDDPDYVFLHRFMIDKELQGKGYGRSALRKAIDLFREEFPSAKCVELMHYPDNKIGEALYISMNFKPTGELRPSEPCRIEADTENPNRFVEIVRRFYY